MRLQLRNLFPLLLAAGVGAQADDAQGQSVISASQMLYDEGKLGVQVNETEIEALIEFDSKDKLNLLFLYDSITGASPNGIPTTVSGGSSIAGSGLLARGQSFEHFKDARVMASVGYTLQYNREWSLNGSVSRSQESDYLSNGVVLGATGELNAKNTTVTLTLRANADTIDPKIAGTLDPYTGVAVKGGAKTTNEVSVLVTQLLDSRSLASLGGFVGSATGYLNDPYKQVWVYLNSSNYLNGNKTYEKRPDVRSNFGVQAQYKNQILDETALQLDYRFYHDDWGINSNTLRLKVLQTFGEKLMFTYFYRYYNQTAAGFWVYDITQADFPGKTNYSADIRLSAFTGHAGGITGYYQLDDQWRLNGQFARYVEKAAGGGEEEEAIPLFNTSGAMLAATVMSVGLEYKY